MWRQELNICTGELAFEFDSTSEGVVIYYSLYPLRFFQVHVSHIVDLGFCNAKIGARRLMKSADVSNS